VALILDKAQYVANWVAAQSGNYAPTVDAAIGIEKDGELVAGVYFDCLTTNNIFAHIANTAELLPIGLLRAVATYVYVDLGIQRMTFVVSAGNEAVCNLVIRMGGWIEGVMRKADGEHDCYLFALWVNEPFVQRVLKQSEESHGK
jgi:hypothetical protein